MPGIVSDFKLIKAWIRHEFPGADWTDPCRVPPDQDAPTFSWKHDSKWGKAGLTKETALQNADALVTVTEWQQFRAPDFDLIKESLKTPVIFDGRNMYDPVRMKQRGITYFSIGRP